MSLAALVLIPGCQATKEPHTDPSPLVVEYAGCRAVREGPVCILDENLRLEIWVATTAAAKIEIDDGTGNPLTLDFEPIQGGLRTRMAVSPKSERLTVRVSNGGRTTSWTLRIEPAEANPPWFDQARSEFLEGRPEDARNTVSSGMETGSRDQRTRALGWLGRIDLATGDVDSAHDHLRRAIESHRRQGTLSGAVDDGTVLVYSLIHDRRDFAEARRVLSSLTEGWGEPAETSYYLAYYRGLLATETSDARNALTHLDKALLQAERLDLGKLRRAAGQILSRQLQRLGRRQESQALLVDLIDSAPADLPPCERGQLLNNLGWNRLLALEAGEIAASPLPELAAALQIFRDGCRQLPAETVNVLLNLSLAHLHEGDVGPAAGRLEEARGEKLGWEPRLQLWATDLAARIALAEGRTAESLRLYSEMQETARALDAPLLAWQAMVGRGRALEAAGDVAGAVEVLARAEASLADETLRIPIHGGRESFLARREWATRRLILLLLQADRFEEALAAVRRSRTRVVRSLGTYERLGRLDSEQRGLWDTAVAGYKAERDRIDSESANDWQLPADRLVEKQLQRLEEQPRLRDQLDGAFALIDRTKADESRQDPEIYAAPPSGELLLVYQPLSSGWIGFAQDGTGLETRHLSCRAAIEEAPPAELSECLLAPFRRQIERAETLRVLPIGGLKKVDFHALEFGGDVLLAGRRVVYGLDLATSPPARSGAPMRALLVADPQMNLPAARREAQTVKESLIRRRPSWNVETLAGDTATSKGVRDRLSEADLFHFAGHAVFAGRGGWDSVLPLADGSDLTVGDILTLQRVPRSVVLSACESGRSSALVSGESLGLAQAFLSVGSIEAIATTRPVDDRTAATIIRSLYRHWTPDTRLSDALRRAQLDLRRNNPNSDWASFRALVL